MAPEEVLGLAGATLARMAYQRGIAYHSPATNFNIRTHAYVLVVTVESIGG